MPSLMQIFLCPAGHLQSFLSIRTKESNSVVKIFRLPTFSQTLWGLHYEARLLTCFPFDPRIPALLAAESGRGMSFARYSYSICLLIGISHTRLHADWFESLILRAPEESWILVFIQQLIKCCQHSGSVWVLLPLFVFLFPAAEATKAFLIRSGPEVV